MVDETSEQLIIPSNFGEPELTKREINDLNRQTFNYSQFRNIQHETLGDLWDERIPLTHNFMTLAKESVILPYADIQLPVITAYAFIPSAMATVVPLLFIQGSKGSGKSTLCIIISALHNAPIMSAATTFAALRNQFNQLRWEMPDICRGEKNTCLLLDNVNKDTLHSESLYTMLLNGYNRKTDAISISKGNGENMDFRVFGLKVLSSVHPVYTQSKYAELSRRCLVVKCKQFEQMTVSEKESLNIDDDFRITERLEPENFDLSVLHYEFDKFWKQESKLIEYTAIKRQLNARKKKFKIPDVIDGAKWTVSVDLLTTGIVAEVWSSIEEGIAAIGKYWEWYNGNVLSNRTALHAVLKDFINDEITIIDKANKEFGSEIVVKEIVPDKLKKHVIWTASKGMLDVTPTPATIADVMADLGWLLDKGNNGNIAWIPSLR